MPLYSDANYYYTGGSSQLFAPYYPTGVYSIPSVSSAYAPYTSSYNRSFTGNYALPISPTPRSPSYTTHTHGLSSRYQPKLSTIGETSPLITSSRHNAMLPLTRIHSPKITSYSSATSLHSKYIPPRPIKMNTADIDVSAARQRKHEEEVIHEMPKTDTREEQTHKESSIIEEHTESTDNKAMRSTIKRNRPIVRLSTVRARNKDSPKTKLETENKLLQETVSQLNEKKMGWRQKMAEDLALLAPSQTKKSPGQLLRERHLIQDAKAKEESEELMREVVVEVDAVNQICHVSMPSGPTFHDICEDISSDKIDDDLNAGKLRKRASIIQEHEHQLLNQLQQSASGSFQLIHLERRASHDSSADETHQLTTSNVEATQKQSKKIKHTITAIVDVQNAPLIPILQEGDEDLLSPPAKLPSIPKISYNLDEVEEHHQIHKIFKLPKKKSIRKSLKSQNSELPAGFVQAIPKAKRGSKHIKPKKYINTAEIFTFDNQTIQEHQQLKDQENIFSSSQENQITEDVEKSREKNKNYELESNKSTAVEKINDPKPVSINVSKVTSETKSTKVIDNAMKQKATASKIQEKNLEKVTEEPIATPKPIRKCIKKSESDEDFWAHIGTRETIYMANRKNILEQFALPKVEIMSEPSNLTETLQKHNLETETKHMVHKTDMLRETTLPKVEIMCEASKIQSPKILETGKKVTTPEVTEQSKTLTEQSNRKSRSFREETTLKVAETKRAKSVETDNIMKKPCQTKNAAITTETTTKIPTTKAIMPKIQTGKEAKSPEKQQQQTQVQNQKISPKATKTTAVTMTTTTTATTSNSAPSNESKNKCIQNVKNMNNTTITAKNSKFDATTTTTASTIPRTTTTAQVKPTTTTTPAAMAEKENDIKSIAEVEKKLDATMKTTSHALDVREVKEAELIEEPTTKGFAINKAKTSPINADGFITIAPVKTAVAVSPTNAKNKNASPTIKTDKVKMTTNAPIPTTITIMKTTTAQATSAMTTATTTTVTATAAVTTTTTLTSDKTDRGKDNNLSKFATVLDLAQCLRDVDADLEDYIPSSAENSNDEDDLSDGSSVYCSSVDGCENLSASMKKKLKQKKRKEKQAEKARFDPHKKIKIDTTNKCYVKEETPRFPLVATPRPLWKREKIVYPDESSEEESESDESGTCEETEEDSEENTSTSEEEYEHSPAGTVPTTGSSLASSENSAIIRMSTCSNDSGFEGGTAPSSPKKMLGAREARDSPSTPPSLNPAYKIEAEQDETSYTYTQFQKSGRFAPPATVIPRFKNYTVDDFHFLAVLGKGSFGKVLLAELRDTTYYYAVKCLKKDVVLEDDDVDSTLIERKVLALGTKHPYLCHLFCTFQTESHLFFVMEYLNGGDLMFHIQESGRFTEERARFYGAEIISGLKFLHKKGIIYRDLKLDNVLLDFEGHVRIADFGMCKLQIYLDKTADSFCGTPDYMAPEIIKGEKYNQNVDWWSFGVLLYEMLIGQSPFSGCDEDELFWSICNEIPWFPVFISAEATSILKGLLEKDYTKRIGSQYSPAGEVSEHIFFRSIDWNLLEKKQLDPPFKPQVKHPLDTQYFDRVFTRERVRLTPVDKEILQSIDQKQFMGFTYTNPHIALD